MLCHPHANTGHATGGVSIDETELNISSNTMISTPNVMLIVVPQTQQQVHTAATWLQRPGVVE